MHAAIRDHGEAVYGFPNYVPNLAIGEPYVLAGLHGVAEWCEGADQPEVIPGRGSAGLGLTAVATFEASIGWKIGPVE
jgi:hypothetical protein